jgi:hypothetical protein
MREQESNARSNLASVASKASDDHDVEREVCFTFGNIANSFPSKHFCAIVTLRRKRLRLALSAELPR